MKFAIIAVLGLLSKLAFACPTGTFNSNETWKNKKLFILQGRYISDIVLTENYSYQLKGGVFIGNDNKDNATLTVEAGTYITGATGADFLVITRGSKLHAEGSKNSPIIFTAKNSTTRGSWGGIVLNGNAPINCSSPTNGFCEAEGEGSTGLYGGKNPKDNSGILKYVRVEYAGFEITPENELNGISFQGVGAQTTVDYVQVYMNADDGIEFFGGTVNIKHVVLTGNKDDSLDWTSGWVGNAQFVLIEQSTDEGNNGIEADSLSSPMDAEPRSNPTLSNITLLGSETAKKGGVGILLRRGTGLKLYNSIVKGFKQAGLDVDDEETFRNGHAYTNGLPGIHITNTVFDNKVNFLEEANEESLSDWVLRKMDLDVLFGLVPNREEIIPMRGNISTVEMETVIPEDSDGFFEEVLYIGAIENEDNDWTSGWTIK